MDPNGTSCPEVIDTNKAEKMGIDLELAKLWEQTNSFHLKTSFLSDVGQFSSRKTLCARSSLATTVRTTSMFEAAVVNPHGLAW